MRYRTRLALVLVALALFASGVSTVFLGVLARHSLVEAIESKAMSIASTAAATIDGDAHRAVAAGAGGPERDGLARQLAAVRDANRRKDVHVEYIYTAVPEPDAPGRLVAVLDAGPGSTGRLPDLAAKDRIQLGKTGVEEMKTDAYGTWVSGYAPVRDGAGRAVATLVVDVAAGDLLGRTRQLLGGGLTAALVALLLAAGVTFPVAERVTRPLERVTETLARIAGGDLQARVRIDRADEFGRVAEAVNAMVPKLRDHVRLRESVRLAQTVQQNLLPRSWPRIAGFRISGTSDYCDEIGGDYYDVFDLSRGDAARIGVVVGDVTGHGIAAALLMATTRAMLRSRAAFHDAPSAIVTDVNASICRDQFSERFVTLFFLVIDAADCTLRWVCAGHEAAILYDPATDTFEELKGKDLPLGVRAEWTYREESRTGWRAGQVILIGTDGIWEARDPAGRVFGTEAVRALVREHASKDAEGIQRAILDALRAFRGSRPQDDDVTIVVLKA